MASVGEDGYVHFRVNVTRERYEQLQARAEARGLSVPLYTRSILYQLLNAPQPKTTAGSSVP